ncbi:hypothetical protein [Bradyrhizobium sp. 23AC]
MLDLHGISSASFDEEVTRAVLERKYFHVLERYVRAPGASVRAARASHLVI